MDETESETESFEEQEAENWFGGPASHSAQVAEKELWDDTCQAVRNAISKEVKGIATS